MKKNYITLSWEKEGGNCELSNSVKQSLQAQRPKTCLATCHVHTQPHTHIHTAAPRKESQSRPAIMI